MKDQLVFPQSEKELHDNICQNILYLMETRNLTLSSFSSKCDLNPEDLKRWLKPGGSDYPELRDLVKVRDGMWIRIQWLIEPHDIFIPGDEDLDPNSFSLQTFITP